MLVIFRVIGPFAYPPKTLKAILAATDAAVTMQGPDEEPPVAA